MMSMMGFAARPVIDVLPTCSMLTTGTSSNAVDRDFRIWENSVAQAGFTAKFRRGRQGHALASHEAWKFQIRKLDVER